MADTTKTAQDERNTTPPKEDGPLDSLGKAIADPIGTAAEPEELKKDGTRPMTPGS